MIEYFSKDTFKVYVNGKEIGTAKFINPAIKDENKYICVKEVVGAVDVHCNPVNMKVGDALYLGKLLEGDWTDGRGTKEPIFNAYVRESKVVITKTLLESNFTPYLVESENNILDRVIE